MILDYAEAFVALHAEDSYEEFRFELLKQLAVDTSVTETDFKGSGKAELAEKIVADINAQMHRRAEAMAATAYPVLEQVYQQHGQMYETISIPITDGHKGFQIPVSLKKAVDTKGAEVFRAFSKIVMLIMIDDNWKDHLRDMDDLKQSVQNASYEQKDPLLIYKFESFEMFRTMIEKINRETLSILLRAFIPVRETPDPRQLEQQQRRPAVPPTDMSKLQTSRSEAAARAGEGEKSKPAPVRAEKKVGRNDPCPCGSGKKYKNCHGKGM